MLFGFVPQPQPVAIPDFQPVRKTLVSSNAVYTAFNKIIAALKY